MKKKTPYILIALMGFSLIGIIWVQMYWINNGLKVKEAQFNQLVNDALNDVVIGFEDNESVSFIHKQLANSTSDITIETDSITNKTKSIKKWVSQHFEIESDDDDEDSFNYSMTTDDNGEGVEMKISINGEEQTIDINQKIESLEEVIDSTTMLISGTKEKIFGNRFGNVIIKMVNEFKDIENPIEHLLKDLAIEPIIKNKLSDNGIT
ncbi:MAG: hypothetical protein P8Q14_09300, partial [Vicingaceae bacterium]|nr:hypothetical protein [Vicingaceae bacterium]